MNTSTRLSEMSREDRAIYRALRTIEKQHRVGGVAFGSPEDCGNYLRLLLGNKEHEEFVALWLNTRNQLIQAEVLFIGTVAECRVYPREVIKAALRHNAVRVIFAHNHPSGASEPSAADRALHATLRDAMSVIEVEVLDNFVVTAFEVRSIVHPGAFTGHGTLPAPKRHTKPRKAA